MEFPKAPLGLLAMKGNGTIHPSIFLLVIALCRPPFAFSQDGTTTPLVRGENRIATPARVEGLSLHPLFQSEMILQRDQPLKIWGWGEPGENIRVHLDQESLTAIVTEKGTWEAVFEAREASFEPLSLEVSDSKKTIRLDGILVGDVWVLGGQSNMEHPISRVEDGDLEIASANFSHLRFLTVPYQEGPDLKTSFARLDEWSDWFGTHYRKGFWETCTPQTVRELSAIGYTFARRLQMAAQIPIGLIDVSRGGTTVETWTPEHVLRSIQSDAVQDWLQDWDSRVTQYDAAGDLRSRQKAFQDRVKRLEAEGKPIPGPEEYPNDLRPGPAMDMNRPGNCYASMLHPIAGFSVKGVIWHQGYNNALQPEGHVLYRQVFPEMITAWRAAFNQPTLPFGIISLCTEGPPQTRDNYLEMMVNEGPYIREVQYRAFLDKYEAGDKNIGFASSYDMRRSWYHPEEKVPVGERIARWALATQYGKNLPWKPPAIIDVSRDGNRLILTMDQRVNDFRDWPIQGFAISGNDRRFAPAAAEFFVKGTDDRNRPIQDRTRIVLTSPEIPEPVHFRYAWGRNPWVNLLPLHSEGRIPLATQRSDTWRIHEVPVAFGASADRQSINQARQANRMFDLQRRIREAEDLIEESASKNKSDIESWEKKWNP